MWLDEGCPMLIEAWAARLSREDIAIEEAAEDRVLKLPGRFTRSQEYEWEERWGDQRERREWERGRKW